MLVNIDSPVREHDVAEVSLFSLTRQQVAHESARCVRRQISFNGCDQLWNADRLGEKWMSLDLQARSCLSSRHQSRQKDDRCSVQYWIGFNPRGDLAAIRFGHDNIKKDKMRGFSFGLFNRRGKKISFYNSTHNISLSLGHDW
jgi:hypothetical protein